jgi:serine/threonine protein kinase
VTQRDLAAWLETLDHDMLTTVASRPMDTIRPAFPSRRRLGLIEELEQLGTIALRVGKAIGQGGMGVVHEAEQVALGRTVAIKTLRPDNADPVSAQHLLREAWITGSLEHPNIVPVHHLELDAERKPVLVLKRVDGIEWHRLLDDAGEVKRRFGAADLLAWNLGILHQVLNALRFAHQCGIVHRDVKPSNVMVGHFGEVYLLDWGLAVAMLDDGTGRVPLASEATSFAGTPGYMAPEMLGGETPSLSARTDVYLAGAVLYQLIAGHPPHRGSNALAIVASVAASNPEFPADAPAELVQICRVAMRADPAQRHDSIATLQTELQRYLEQTATPSPGHRQRIYSQLAICRFAFHEALATWRDNAAARAGLQRATCAVAEYELSCGDPRAALTLLGELDDRPAELYKRAHDAGEALTAQQRQLEALGREHDPTVAPKARRVVLAFAFAFTIIPAGMQLFGLRDLARTHVHHLLWTTLYLVVLVLAWFVAHRKRGLSAVNRRIFAAGVVLFCSQLALEVGLAMLDLPMSMTFVMMAFLYAVVSAMFAIATDRWLLIAPVGYLVAFLVASAREDLVMYALSAGNGVLALTVTWRWNLVFRHRQ